MAVPPQDRAKTQLAQLLADVIVNHAPHTARVNAEESRRAVDGWLEDLEAHTQRFVAPFLQQILDNSDPPEPVRALLEEAISPTAALSATIEQVFLFGIVSNVIGVAVAPFLQEVSNALYTTAVSAGIRRPVDPAAIATALGRGVNLGDPVPWTLPAWAQQQAYMSGIGDQEINLMGSLIGLPPSLQELFEMHRRGILPTTAADGSPLTIETGLQQGDFKDEWIAAASQLAYGWLTPGDFVRAAVQAQMSYADAKTWANKTGLDTSTGLPVDTGGSQATPDMFGLAYAIAGRPPGPEELARMAHRNIIPWTGTGAGTLSFQQGVAESDVKTKWTAALQALSAYVPPPREVGTLLGHGAITQAQAQTYWQEGGVAADLAAALATMTLQEHISQDKLLAKGEILTGYFDQIFTSAQATELLGLIGYVDTVAADMLAIVDFRREIQAINSVVRKIGTLYEGFKITAANATTALEAVGVSGAQASSLLNTWNTLRIAPVRVPSASDIAKAVKYGTIDQAEALAALAELGYQPRDAAIVLSANGEIAVTPLPAAGSGVVG